MVKTPQETGCTTIEVGCEGTTNGLLSMANGLGYELEYDEEADVYRIGEYKG